MKELIEHLEKNDFVCVENENTQESRNAIKTLLNLLKSYPDIYEKIKGSYQLNEYRKEKFELFYIKDIAIFKQLLLQKKYSSFMHEVHDFIIFKILHEDTESDDKILPKNIKDAMIFTIETSFL